MDEDKKFIRRAIEIAENSIRDGGGPFGAVITKEGNIISEANNRVVAMNDPTAHAEILAIRDASSILNSFDLSSCTLYSSCEPCPMCLGAIYWAGIKRVVYSSDRNDAAASGFNDKLIYDEIALPPHERRIIFYRIDDPAAKEVFRKWGQFENKISY